MYPDTPMQDFRIMTYPRDDTSCGPLLEVRHANTTAAVALLEEILDHEDARIEEWNGVSLIVTCGQHLLSLGGEVRNAIPNHRKEAPIAYEFRRATSRHVAALSNRFIMYATRHPERCSDQIKAYLTRYAEAMADLARATQR